MASEANGGAFGDEKHFLDGLLIGFLGRWRSLKSHHPTLKPTPLRLGWWTGEFFGPILWPRHSENAYLKGLQVAGCSWARGTDLGDLHFYCQMAHQMEKSEQRRAGLPVVLWTLCSRGPLRFLRLFRAFRPQLRIYWLSSQHLIWRRWVWCLHHLQIDPPSQTKKTSNNPTPCF